MSFFLSTARTTIPILKALNKISLFIGIFQGRFELLSLSGLFLLAENGQRNGSLSVSLAGPDGRVIGGRVAGSLRAASPVQVTNASVTHK